MEMGKRWSKPCCDKGRWISAVADGGELAAKEGTKEKPTGNKSVKISINNLKYHFQTVFSREL